MKCPGNITHSQLDDGLLLLYQVFLRQVFSVDSEGLSDLFLLSYHDSHLWELLWEVSHPSLPESVGDTLKLCPSAGEPTAHL